MPVGATFYGLMGFTHGWGKVLTVMSPQGIGAVLDGVDPGDEAVLESAPGQLPRFVERRGGGLDRLARSNGIIVLSNQDWDAKKAELGETVFR